jgi:hypothetical protein
LTDRFDREVCYTGTDGIISPRYIGISTARLIERLRLSRQVGFDPQTGHGAIPHLWPSLERCGKIGATFIAASSTGCDAVERDFIALLEELGSRPPEWCMRYLLSSDRFLRRRRVVVN